MTDGREAFLTGFITVFLALVTALFLLTGFGGRSFTTAGRETFFAGLLTAFFAETAFFLAGVDGD